MRDIDVVASPDELDGIRKAIEATGARVVNVISEGSSGNPCFQVEADRGEQTRAAYRAAWPDATERDIDDAIAGIKPETAETAPGGDDDDGGRRSRLDDTE